MNSSLPLNRRRLTNWPPKSLPRSHLLSQTLGKNNYLSRFLLKSPKLLQVTNILISIRTLRGLVKMCNQSRLMSKLPSPRYLHTALLAKTSPMCTSTTVPWQDKLNNNSSDMKPCLLPSSKPFDRQRRICHRTLTSKVTPVEILLPSTKPRLLPWNRADTSIGCPEPAGGKTTFTCTTNRKQFS